MRTIRSAGRRFYRSSLAALGPCKPVGGAASAQGAWVLAGGIVRVLNLVQLRLARRYESDWAVCQGWGGLHRPMLCAVVLSAAARTSAGSSDAVGRSATLSTGTQRTGGDFLLLGSKRGWVSGGPQDVDAVDVLDGLTAFREVLNENGERRGEGPGPHRARKAGRR